MPTSATIARQNTTANPNTGRANNAPAAYVPFVRASAEHREPAGIDVSRQLIASDQDLSVFDIPAYGYLRSLVILVQATGGAGTTVTGTEDAPFNVLKNVYLTEPNGAVIAQFNSGYDLFLANKWGGFRNPVGSDPRSAPIYSAIGSATGNFQFALRLPIEINPRDALGSLPNQNAAATFKLRLSLAKIADVMSTVTTAPTVRVRVFLEAWDQPEASNGGQANQVTPPALNTTQFWTTQILNYSAGQQTLRLTRVGNYLRSVILLARRAGTARSTGDADMPDPVTLYLDTRPLDIVERNNWKLQMYERSGNGGAVGATVPANDSANGLDAGVFVYDFAHEFDGLLGRENRDLWLPTLPSTRLELQGNFGTAGVLTVLTNDVAVAGPVFI
jgi:hypothetical protein